MTNLKTGYIVHLWALTWQCEALDLIPSTTKKGGWRGFGMHSGLIWFWFGCNTWLYSAYLALSWRITPGRLRTPSGISGVNIRLAIVKTKELPTVLLHQSPQHTQWLEFTFLLLLHAWNHDFILTDTYILENILEYIC